MLQYASLKAVLQYLDANIRFQIYNRCPSIRKTERAVPLYIKNLEFIPGVYHPNMVVVNSTTYYIGTIRIYPSGVKIQNEHNVENKTGGVGLDLDQFGIEDNTLDSHLTPGDILIGRARRAWRFSENQLDDWIGWFEAFDMLLALKRTEKPFILDRQHPYYVIMQQFENQSITAIRTYVKNTKNIVLPHLNRRNNITVPYTTEIQMTVKSWREAEKVYRYPGKKLYQVEKKLLTMFFGSRKHIYVKSLEIDDAQMIRFPVDMLIKIQQLYMLRYTFKGLDAVTKIVHPTSLPLETIKFSYFEKNEIQHDLVKLAKKLIVTGFLKNMTTFLEVATQNVEIEIPKINPEDYLVLARNWLETRRTVGTCYVFKFEQVTVVDEVMRLLKNELNAEAVGAQCLKVRIDETSTLKIAYQKVEEMWRMQFKVISE